MEFVCIVCFFLLDDWGPVLKINNDTATSDGNQRLADLLEGPQQMTSGDLANGSSRVYACIHFFLVICTHRERA